MCFCTFDHTCVVSFLEPVTPLNISICVMLEHELRSCHTKPNIHICLLMSVMSIAVWRRRYISHRQTQHGGFGGGDIVRGGKVWVRKRHRSLSLSVSVAPLSSLHQDRLQHFSTKMTTITMNTAFDELLYWAQLTHPAWMKDTCLETVWRFPLWRIANDESMPAMCSSTLTAQPFRIF